MNNLHGGDWLTDLYAPVENNGDSDSEQEEARAEDGEGEEATTSEAVGNWVMQASTTGGVLTQVQPRGPPAQAQESSPLVVGRGQAHEMRLVVIAYGEAMLQAFLEVFRR